MHFHDEATAACTHIERDFLRALMGGCSTPISALARIERGDMMFEGNILSKNGLLSRSVSKKIALAETANLGHMAAQELLQNGGREILELLN
jgi:hydroxymethylbilane synthase